MQRRRSASPESGLHPGPDFSPNPQRHAQSPPSRNRSASSLVQLEAGAGAGGGGSAGAGAGPQLSSRPFLDLEAPHFRSMSPSQARLRARPRPGSGCNSPAHPRLSSDYEGPRGARSSRPLSPLRSSPGSGGGSLAHPRYAMMSEAEGGSSRSGSAGRRKGRDAAGEGRIPASASMGQVTLGQAGGDTVREWGSRPKAASVRSPLRSRLGTLESPLTTAPAEPGPRAAISPLRFQDSPSRGGSTDPAEPVAGGAQAAWARRPVSPIRYSRSPLRRGPMGPGAAEDGAATDTRRARSPMRSPVRREVEGLLAGQGLWDISPGVSESKKSPPRHQRSPLRGPHGGATGLGTWDDGTLSDCRRPRSPLRQQQSPLRGGPLAAVARMGSRDDGTVSDFRRSPLRQHRSPLRDPRGAGAGRGPWDDGTLSDARQQGSPVALRDSPGRGSPLHGGRGAAARARRRSLDCGTRGLVPESRSMQQPVASAEERFGNVTTL